VPNCLCYLQSIFIQVKQFYSIYIFEIILQTVIFFNPEKTRTFEHKYYTHGEQRCQTYVMLLSTLIYIL
jgi:hypothetical protein